MAGRGARDREAREARKRARSFSIRQQVHLERGRRRRRDDLIALIVFVVVIALATTAQVGYFTAGPGKPVANATPTATPTPTPTATVPDASLSENRTWKATMTIGGAKLGLQLDGKKAPQAVANFLTLIEQGYYTGAYCPRLTAKTVYVLQCGTKTESTSDAGPGYSFGPIENAPKDGVYDTGVLAMARVGGDASSQGSQFFIVYGKDSTFPDDAAGGYTVFGTVTSGLPALKADVVANGLSADAKAGGDGAPATPIRITAAAVTG